MFKELLEFIKSFPAVEGLNAEQQKKAMQVFNAMKAEDPSMDDGKIIAVAMSTAKKGPSDEKMDEGNFYYVSMLAEPEGKTSIIEVLKTGKVHDRDLVVTKEMMLAYVKNFREGVYGTDIQVNLRHDRNGEAAGWLKNLYVEGERLFAEVEWTPLGIEKVGTKRYKFTSSELAASFPHHETGEPVKNVLIGVALTNIPAVKGLKAVTLSEQAQIYISNFDHMKKFKELLAELKGKKTVTAAEFTQLDEAAQAAVDAGEATEAEVKDANAEVESKVEKAPEAPADKTEAPAAPAAPANEALSMVKLAERLDNLAEENDALRKEVATLSEKNKESASKIELSELADDVKKTMCLSEGKKSTGFKPEESTVGRVAKFMQSLSEEGRKEFKEILALHQTVDLSERGTSNGTAPVNQDLNEDLKAANAEAKKRYDADKSKELHEHLADVYAEQEAAKA